MKATAAAASVRAYTVPLVHAFAAALADDHRQLQLQLQLQQQPQQRIAWWPFAADDDNDGFECELCAPTAAVAAAADAAAEATEIELQRAQSPLPEDLRDSPSRLLRQTQYEQLCRWLPPRLQTHHAEALFLASRDGFNLRSLFDRCAGRAPLVFVLRTLPPASKLFGAFLPVALRPTPGRYYGTGEAFLFRLAPDCAAYEWAPGLKGYYLHVEPRSVSVGGGRRGVGLWFDDELLSGVSERCDTFRNDPLNGDDGPDFGIADFEVLTFVP